MIELALNNQIENLSVLEEPSVNYGVADLIYKEDVFNVVGKCMEVHRMLGRGFSEVVYKDAMEFEFKKCGWKYEREKKFSIQYKEVVLPHYYFADFVYDNKIIIEVKAQQGIIDAHFKQTINYLAAAKFKLGLILNFGEDSLKFKRVIL